VTDTDWPWEAALLEQRLAPVLICDQRAWAPTFLSHTSLLPWKDLSTGRRFGVWHVAPEGEPQLAATWETLTVEQDSPFSLPASSVRTFHGLRGRHALQNPTPLFSTKQGSAILSFFESHLGCVWLEHKIKFVCCFSCFLSFISCFRNYTYWTSRGKRVTFTPPYTTIPQSWG
jgi:hypothetical protein